MPSELEFSNFSEKVPHHSVHSTQGTYNNITIYNKGKVSIILISCTNFMIAIGEQKMIAFPGKGK